jgi:hypothetical protein
MRFVAGVDESLMDRVPWERPRYASLGAVVLGVATIGASSMWFAMRESTVAGPASALLPASIWFVFIVILDRWIVSTRSADPWQKVLLLLTRVTLAVLFGVVIAEPLVLRVFQTQIEHQVRTDRAQTLRTLETKLQACNPDPADRSASPEPADCAAGHYLLALDTTPAGQLRQLTDLQAQVGALQQTIAADSTALEALNKRAADECAGHSGAGLTGRWGEGINCVQDRRNAQQYASAHPIQDQQRQLAALQQQLADLQKSTTDAQGQFVRQRTQEIRQRLAALPPVQAPIGLLERMGTLSALGGSNATLWWGIVLVRLLFITIDCAPALLKMAGGSTYYDRMVLASSEEASTTYTRTLEGRSRQQEMDREESEQLRKRERAIRMQQHLSEAVDARAAVYERQGGGQ